MEWTLVCGLVDECSEVKNRATGQLEHEESELLLLTLSSVGSGCGCGESGTD